MGRILGRQGFWKRLYIIIIILNHKFWILTLYYFDHDETSCHFTQLVKIYNMDQTDKSQSDLQRSIIGNRWGKYSFFLEILIMQFFIFVIRMVSEVELSVIS